jgi:hypothetical protein
VALTWKVGVGLVTDLPWFDPSSLKQGWTGG